MPVSRVRSLPSSTRGVVAALLATTVVGIVHELALSGYQKWSRGGSDVEAFAVRPELLALDVRLSLAETIDHLRGARQSCSEPVQVVSLSRRPSEIGGSAELASVVAKLADLGVRVVVLDVEDPFADGAGAESLRASFLRTKIVLVWRAELRAARGIPPAADARFEQLLEHGVPEEGTQPTIPVLPSPMPGAALFGNEPLAARLDVRDPDGLVRREPVLLSVVDPGSRRRVAFLSPAVEAVRISLGLERSAIHVDGDSLILGDRRVRISADGLLVVDHRRRAGVWSTADLLRGNPRAECFRDSIVVVGGSRNADPIPFPLAQALQTTLSHSEHVASAAIALLSGRGLVRLSGWDPAPSRPWWIGFGPFLTILLGPLAGAAALALPRLRALQGRWGPILATLLAFALPGMASFAISLWVLDTRGVWLDIFYPGIAMMLGAVVAPTVEAVVGGEERRRMRRMIGQMLPPEIARRALENPEILAMQGAVREMTILFADLRGFTAFSESHPPEMVVDVLRRYQTVVTRAIRANGGAVDKLMGDGTMAFFGGLQDGDNQHAINAVRSALAMLDALDALNLEWGKQGIAPLAMGVGINTGKAVVGNMGTDDLIAYTVLGDPVNVAARLETMNKDYKTSILVGEQTAIEVGPSFKLREVGVLPVRGRAKSIRVFEVMRTAPIRDS